MVIQQSYWRDLGTRLAALRAISITQLPLRKPRQSMRWPLWSAIPALALAGITGATLAYFLDRSQGRRRRHMTRDRLIGLTHRSAAHADRWSRLINSYLYGLAQKLAHLSYLRHTAEPAPNDETLAQRVRSQVMRNPALHKHRININAERGLVILRGEIDDPKQMRALEKKARKVHGVRDVENLLHLPGCPAPTHL